MWATTARALPLSPVGKEHPGTRLDRPFGCDGDPDGCAVVKQIFLDPGSLSTANYTTVQQKALLRRLSSNAHGSFTMSPSGSTRSTPHVGEKRRSVVARAATTGKQTLTTVRLTTKPPDPNAVQNQMQGLVSAIDHTCEGSIAGGSISFRATANWTAPSGFILSTPDSKWGHSGL